MDAVTQAGRSTAMATPRSMIVDESLTRWYHCTSCCVRRAFLCGDGNEHRKDWIEDWLRRLVGIFAVDRAGYAVMDNRLHALLRLDSPRAPRPGRPRRSRAAGRPSARRPAGSLLGGPARLDTAAPSTAAAGTATCFAASRSRPTPQPDQSPGRSHNARSGSWPRRRM